MILLILSNVSLAILFIMAFLKGFNLMNIPELVIILTGMFSMICLGLWLICEVKWKKKSC